MRKSIYLKIITSTLVLALSHITGCRKTEVIPSEEQLGFGNKNSAKTFYTGDQKFDLLGCGYDVTGKFASPESGKLQVVDAQKLFQDDNLSILQNDSVKTDVQVIGGSDAETYSRALSQYYKVSLGEFATKPLFKAQVYAAFRTTTFSSQFSCAYASFLVKQRAFKFTVPTSTLRTSYLTNRFKSDVNTLSPAQLVEYYGTHVLTGIALGGKLELSYQSESKSSSKAGSAMYGASANGLSKVFSINSNYKDSTRYTSSNSNQTLWYNTVGGDASTGLAGVLKPDNNPSPISIANWQGGLTPENAALIQIDSNGLAGLWEFIENPVKKANVYTYISQYLDANKVYLTHQSIPVYQFYHYNANHFTSANPQAVAGLSGWRYDGPEFRAFSYQVPNSVPIYLFYNGKTFDHFISKDINATLGHANWESYGISFYAFPTQQPGTIPVYEYYHAGSSDHYTTKDPNIANLYAGWVKYDVSFYVYPN